MFHHSLLQALAYSQKENRKFVVARPNKKDSNLLEAALILDQMYLQICLGGKGVAERIQYMIFMKKCNVAIQCYTLGGTEVFRSVKQEQQHLRTNIQWTARRLRLNIRVLTVR